MPYRRTFRRYRPRRRFYRRRRYRPRGYRRSPMYSAFTQIRNLQRQRELKYTTEYTQAPVSLGPPGAHLISLTTGINRGTDSYQRIGRRIKVTSITMNFTFQNEDVSFAPALRFMAFIWKEGAPPSPITDLFVPSASLTQAYFKDDYRFSKKMLMDRKLTFTETRPTVQRTFKFKIPARILTTPAEYNDIFFLILCDPLGSSASPAVTYTSTYRVNFHDS